VAVTTPRRAIPASISPTAITRPVVVVGYRSPYPTVVIVVTDHHSASPIVVMLAPGAARVEHCQRRHRGEQRGAPGDVDHDPAPQRGPGPTVERTNDRD
jgi:hypothetical protein